MKRPQHDNWCSSGVTKCYSHRVRCQLQSVIGRKLMPRVPVRPEAQAPRQQLDSQSKLVRSCVVETMFNSANALALCWALIHSSYLALETAAAGATQRATTTRRMINTEIRSGRIGSVHVQQISFRHLRKATLPPTHSCRRHFRAARHAVLAHRTVAQ